MTDRKTIGVGNSTPDKELIRLKLWSSSLPQLSDIRHEEYRHRQLTAQKLMKKKNISALYLNAGTNLRYFTGTQWHASERMVGAILPKNGPPVYIAPFFEKNTLIDFMVTPGEVCCWQEHENPYALFGEIISDYGWADGKIAVDESAPYFIIDGIHRITPDIETIIASEITTGCRMKKSRQEITLMQRAKNITFEVHKSAAAILSPGMISTEVCQFIHEAHKAAGAIEGSTFCIALFGTATAYPHGVKEPQVLRLNDMVLIDTGCQVNGYNSDITRTYVFGTPDSRQTEVWKIEKEAQLAAFQSAILGRSCAGVDLAARDILEKNGFGPGYKLPGLPHRTGHSIGLDIHEPPYLVKSDQSLLEPGMCFSIEPMICIPGEFGIRHEDHFYMTETGPRWFTNPAHSIENPFGIGSGIQNRKNNCDKEDPV